MAHACELETSLYLHLHPEAVDMARAVDEHGYAETEHAWMDWSDGPLKVMPWWSSFSESGVQGDASKATAAKGEALFEAAKQEISSYVRELRSMPIPKRKDHHP
jgi:creatinine amidohydrolase